MLRYGLNEQENKTQVEIAKNFGCSRSLISKQEKAALVKLRRPENIKKLKPYLD